MGVVDRVFRRQRQHARPSVLPSHPASREWTRRLPEMLRERPPAPREKIALPLVPGAWPEVDRRAVFEAGDGRSAIGAGDRPRGRCIAAANLLEQSQAHCADRCAGAAGIPAALPIEPRLLRHPHLFIRRRRNDGRLAQ